MRKRKWSSYTSGEELFGLAITNFEGLAATEQELTMLDSLYA